MKTCLHFFLCGFALILQAHSLPGSHFISAKEDLGKYIQLSDGSIWICTDSISMNYVAKWSLDQEVILHPTLFPILAGARFYFHNVEKNTIASFELIHSPSHTSQDSCYIENIDFVENLIFTADHTGNQHVWKIKQANLQDLGLWQKEDQIVIGVLKDSISGWFIASSHILFNISQDALLFVDIVEEK